ncbi:DUF515 domain-containing protein [Thermococcus sp. JdF3]|uniref:DUF515 domain-containing protein n=1 Tax=Thermococcus sp. JdF3 TaxID=1638258 RepID=UPI0019809AE2|nr:DUF515 domain-containing protein [Thermococcus sp. JdF3]
MVVLNVSEDIEAKIRRLRELGKASAEPEPPVAPKPAPAKKPSRRPRSVGSIREKERRKRILIGVSIVIIVLILTSVGAYIYLQNRAAEELTNARNKKLAEVNLYFKPDIFNNTNCSPKANAIKSQLLNQILHAKSVDELNAVDVKGSYDIALREYNSCIDELHRVELEKQLNRTKEQKLKLLELEFQPLLSMPLPDDIRTKTVTYMNDLKERVMSATSVDEVNSIKADPYLLEVWRDYYYWRIDALPGQDVILEYGDSKKMVTKADAKAVLGGIMDYKELMKYNVVKVEWVEMSLVLPKRNINGAFLSPGDRIKLFIQGQNTTTVDGYFELVLLPVQSGSISVSESQSQSSSSSTSSSTTYSESHSSSASPGGASISDSSSASDSVTNSQSVSQSSSGSYSYSVNLAEILKAIAAGKIQASEEVKQQLSAYGWKVLDLEKDTSLEAIDHNTQLLVIVKVPSIFVPDVLANQNSLYLVRVST